MTAQHLDAVIKKNTTTHKENKQEVLSVVPQMSDIPFYALGMIVFMAVRANGTSPMIVEASK